jgi:hypothetical protein
MLLPGKIELYYPRLRIHLPDHVHTLDGADDNLHCGEHYATFHQMAAMGCSSLQARGNYGVSMNMNLAIPLAYIARQGQ